MVLLTSIQAVLPLDDGSVKKRKKIFSQFQTKKKRVEKKDLGKNLHKLLDIDEEEITGHCVCDEADITRHSDLSFEITKTVTKSYPFTKNSLSQMFFGKS